MREETIAVAIIARNEADRIQECLKSVKDIVEQIVVLVDDSTHDDTYKIVKNFFKSWNGNGILEYFKWENDFAKARNEASLKCEMDWIMIMDAHEVLHPGSISILKDLKKRVALKVGEPGSLGDALFFSGYAYMYSKIPSSEKELIDTIPDVFFLQPRVFKRSQWGFKKRVYKEEGKEEVTYEELHYLGRSHNYVVGGDPRLKKYPVRELVFVHARTIENAEERKKQRFELNVKNLLADIKDNPEKPRPYFYLAQTYLEAHQLEDAKKYYRKYLDMSEWADERCQAMIALATILSQQEEYDEAYDWALQAVKERWDRGESYLLLGDISFTRKQYYAAEHWYKCSTKMKPPFSSLFLHGPTYTYLPYERLCRLYDKTSRWAEAIENAFQVLKFNPDYEQMHRNIQLWQKNLRMNPNAKRMVFFARGDTFIKPIIEELAKDYNTDFAQLWRPENVKHHDIVWFEWCDVNIVNASNYTKEENQKWVVRLHSYESYTSLPNRVDWDKVDRLIYVAPHIKRKSEKRYPQLKKVKSVLIPNGVDYQRYAFAIRKPGPNFAFVGIFSWKKGIQGLIMTMKHILRKYPDSLFHCRIDFYEGDDTVRQAGDYWDYEINDDPQLKKALRYYPKREAHLDGWLEDMNFMLSVSTIEAFSYYIAEGMSKGIKPLIYNWEGAKEVWPKELVWDDFDDLDKLIEGSYESQSYREYVIEHYSKEKQMASVKKLIKELSEEK